MTTIRPSALNAQILPMAKTQVVSAKSHLANKLKQNPNAQKISTIAAASQAAGAASSPDLTAWSSGRPNAEYTATTGTVTGSTSSGAIKLSLKKGGSYNFGTGYSYTFSGAKPSIYMQITDANGNVVASSKKNALTWNATADGDYTVTIGITAGKGGTAAFSNYTIEATQTLSKIPTSSGDKNIDAVMAGGSYWWHPEGNTAATTTTAISSTVKQLSGASATIYYGYLDGTESYLSTKDKSGFAAVEAGHKTAISTAFEYLSTLINVSFVHDESKANIEFGMNDQTDSAGYANYPLGNGSNPSLLMLDNSNNTGNSSANIGTVGGYGWETLVHELGHAMGLKHPGSYNAGGGKTPAPYLPANLDNRAMSIMSYNDPISSTLLTVSGSQSNSGYSYSYSMAVSNPGTYQTYDIAALQYLYGANKSTTAADFSVDDDYSKFSTIWAPQSGGIALDASTTTRANIFDLRQGGYSSISMRLTDADKIQEIKEKFTDLNFSDANATAAANDLYKSLKSVKNSKKVPGHTALYNGKNNLALSYGSKFSTVTGGSNADKFYAGTYSATVDGGSGTDTVYLQGTAKDWTVDAGKTTATSSSGAVITLKNIEAIAFYKATESLVRK